MNTFNALAIHLLAEAVLAAIPADTTDEQGVAARFDMQNAFNDPKGWFDELGTEQAEWSLEQAVAATAEYTCNGWEDDACRAAFETLFPTE